MPPLIFPKCKEGNMRGGYNTVQFNTSLTPEFNWKETIWMNSVNPTEAKERFLIHISFTTQDPNIRHAESRIPASKITVALLFTVF